MSKISLHKGIAWGLVLAWMGLIFYLSHQAGGESSALSAGVVGFLVKMIETIFPFLSFDLDFLHFFVRKFAHFFAYFILGLLLIYAVHIERAPTWRSIFFSFIVTLAYAISDELHQLFVPGRSGELRDVLIDSFGSSVGMAVYLLLRSFVQKSRGRL